ncbi:hypothetical protein COY26_03485 [Candidatus Woesearchaeota archaeon CG_4_10_14_0_2_um_filter_33_10]|nr:MAG: hypothetical protein AUJ83_00770 [Candidatus Woesearchaeota archaeon CG1_02_33_12]PIN79245.1 MAG: hypothetical protein COV14_00470 [Candidatus Woesearchaeota archaeon CG10_big_fil_rev_8_21_14_0_10_33_12]PIU72480.1 MAG: hypothetical protein COS79_02675 [Candidatus Woesearchaeota archaeon CG06_land_8_20_14_3_00_33_13]PIZ52839.1 MAG: hypothetical protein COY26_03485 [Candidatus Woesearchaeota archaeon CG_4_10_14_0_2_um_filter_33_10]
MEMQGIIKNGNLIHKDEWNKYINGLKTNKPEIDKERCRKLVKDSLVNSIKKRTINLRKFGILFSGGIDSSTITLICKKLNLNFICYSIGLENSKDLEYAKKIADSININLKTKTIKLEEVEKLLKKTIKITKKKDVVNAGVGCVVYAALDLAKKDNNNFILTGMGADELFAGYARFEKTKDIKKECISSIKNIYNDVERDFLISKNLNAELITPFLDKNIIKLAMQTPSEYKIKDNIRKYILREIAIDLGLPREFAFRNKTAAQYGSGIDKAILKLAKKNGFKYKKDYLKSLS